MLKHASITTILVHTPMRPTGCAIRALNSLCVATKMRHKVEFVIQGPVSDKSKFPAPKRYKKFFDLRYFWEKENTGVPTRLFQSVKRLDTDYWAKLDDDAILPRGAWDLLIRCINFEKDRGIKVGAAFMAPIHTRGYVLKVDKKQKLLRTTTTPHSINDQSWAKWLLFDCVGSGATVFIDDVFYDGCNFVPRYKTGGSDVDMFWQMTQKGFKTIMCVRPNSIHEHQRCSNKSYDSIRRSRKELKKSAKIFFERWGLEYVHLRM